MPWVRLDENAMDHPKIGGLHDGAFRLWVTGLAYCQKFLTDGYISDIALKGLRGYHVKRKGELVTATLWESADKGIRIHDYLQWNESKATVMEARQFATIKMILVRNPHLRKQIQDRDGNACHYCGCTVYWNDRKGLTGGTYDHIVQGDGDTIGNLVVACRGCTTKKSERNLDRNLDRNPDLSRSQDLDKSSLHTTSHHTTVQKDQEQERVDEFFNRRISERTQPPNDAEPFDSFEPDLPVQSLLRRAGEFVERYKALHVKLRSGAHYVGKPLADFEESRQLVGVYDDKRLDKLAYVWLNTDHNFAQNGTRSIAKFRSMCSWCEEQLIAFEKQHGELNMGAA